MKAAALPLSRAQVAAVLAFVISSATFLAAQDDETGRCPKVVFKSPVTGRSALLIPKSLIPRILKLWYNEKRLTSDQE